MIGRRSPIALLLVAIGTAAVAVIVHVASVLGFPARAPHDAFARVAAWAPANAVAPAPPGAPPFADAAMRVAICRYDLAAGPLRLTIEPIDASFLSLGLHGRSGRAFSGLNLRAGDRDATGMVLMLPAQRARAEEADSDDEPSQDLRITAPEAEGFVVIETPNQDPLAATARLGRVACATEPPSTGGGSTRP